MIISLFFLSIPTKMSKITPQVAYALEVVVAKLENRKPASLDSFKALIPNTIEEAECPLFVTFDKIKRNQKRLRGCIGVFSPQKLESGIESYARLAAFEDPRFPPITLQEVSDLQCSLTLLTNFEYAKDPLDWEIGKHGIRIFFKIHGMRYSATYLPDVMPEQGWTKEEALDSLVEKAGASGDWKTLNIKLQRYQGQKSKINYLQYKELLS